MEPIEDVSLCVAETRDHLGVTLSNPSVLPALNCHWSPTERVANTPIGAFCYPVTLSFVRTTGLKERNLSMGM